MDIQGHRGCRGLHPENSIPAFIKALALNVTTLELDVVISKDHKVVVSHEPYMNHEIALDPFGKTISQNSELSLNLYAMTYESIKKYDCGSKTHQRFPLQQNEKVYKPLLTEIIDLAEKQSNHKIFFNIEIKSKPEYDDIYTPKVSDFVNLVLEVIQNRGIDDRVILQSFDLRALEAIHVKNTTARLALLVDENEQIESKLDTLSFKPDIISPHFELLTKDIVKKFQENGFQIIPWTVNREVDIAAMMRFGVDGIISDFPDKVIALA